MQKTAYELRISDWSSDVCSSDLSGVSGTGRSFTAAVRSSTARKVSRLRAWAGVSPMASRTCSAGLVTFCSVGRLPDALAAVSDRKSVGVGKRVSVRVDLGGRRIIKNKNSSLYALSDLHFY